MTLTVHTLSEGEAQSRTAHVPDIAYAEESFLLQEERYGARSEFAGIYRDGALAAVIPVNYFPGKEVFSVHKDYTKPYVILEGDIDWQDVVELLKEKYGVAYAELHFVGTSGKKTPLSAFILELAERETQETIWAQYHKKTRNEVRKAEKSNFTVRAGGKEMLEDFYRLYKENMRRHGTPARPLSYFDDFFKQYKEKCGIIATYDGDTAVGANFFLLHNACLRLAFNVSNVAYWDKCVNNLLYDRTIAWGYTRGVRVFDFGPGLNSDMSHNKFKLGFGAKQIPLVKYSAGSKWHALKKWAANKRHALKIRVHKLTKRV
ncbi:hypothetical protein A3C91_02255 [Candidatus Azambacteria bacterium RIFCSPHIGHO2_02_FULL_52_12]|uniref:BioF2-like acetyltransferase domain-containing protein n=1 Tax=Candidatus Azambacteria bacterium RIFCSPLOWO2_01_FULL_46_25 TaxID=1797298 RepID=A0A1F5BVL2_9BACT|nr:MAG: hypothetical protein A3C91_02255 [Candidatus Azambacteria bacterium RIFCSPHIGHO2_02_FULL_52_12]OGD34647.1 MAG: hypothetical protein A2988_04055 [Candidatus Azambacteria bacterium RIFCSPLOWO2_01_FULL_46_25]OGD36516.1 MAG: hypothetical protein A2850_03070 [Candidatus Azambacteria bacterium RIFCSPHIGHO2_01_FULL_51_74]